MTSCGAERVVRTVTPDKPGMVLVDWDDARALRYKVYRQLASDPAPVLVGDNVFDSETVIHGLPSGQSVKVTVVALNDAGPSQPSTPVSIAVP